jgi:hypothetical protein
VKRQFSFIALVLMAQSPAPPIAPLSSDQEDIVVIGRKLKGFKATTLNENGNWSCKVERSTGYEDIDLRACNGLIKCSVVMEPKFYSKEGLTWSTRDPRAYRKQFSKEMLNCWSADRRAMLKEYRARRRASQ